MKILREELEYAFLNSLFKWDDNPFEEEEIIEIIKSFDIELLSSKGRQLLFRAIRKIVEDSNCLPPVEVVENFININAPKLLEPMQAEIINAMEKQPCVSTILKEQIIPLLKKYRTMELIKDVE